LLDARERFEEEDMANLQTQQAHDENTGSGSNKLLCDLMKKKMPSFSMPLSSLFLFLLPSV